MVQFAASHARSVRQHRIDEEQQRQQHHENSSRGAVNVFTFTTQGAGQVTPAQFDFDCIYTEEPSFTSGVAIAKAADPAHYALPQATAGVYRWVTKPLRAGSTELLYTGAFVYFAVKIDPLMAVRTDGSNLIALQQQLTFFTVGSADYLATQALIAEAEEAIYLQANPARATLHHHLSFTGTAMKKLPDEITGLARDKAIRPVVPGL